MLTAKLDVTKIDKAKLFKGTKGTYLDIVLIETPNSQYGDYMIVQSVTKEERERGVKGAILGNAKIMAGNATRPAQQPQKAAPQPRTMDADGEEVPF